MELAGEKIAIKILMRIEQNKNVRWAENNILTFPEKRVFSASKVFEWLRHRKYLCNYNGLVVTDLGLEYLEGLKNKKAIQSGDSGQFKEEALTGLVVRRNTQSGYMVSERSKIDRAVISQKISRPSHQTPEDAIIALEQERKAKRHLACTLNISDARMIQYTEEGRIKLCKKCGEIGVFDKDRKYLKSSCRKCRKNQLRRA